ncbi:PTS sugar transporter subunit IIB [Hufsiella ginkgonis]|uniref:PTS transporter subunit IIB n=1 Tax=Hufsiella ginkgonis TaxID=2695274 RepID=A0A7K1Y069_9SPHI|nr:PTS sugar transporter subunit IIB [Hufsiella ginkgonis]MXV16448.1 PTS transporter subunit IIB [Hufsiella ginkgonis]
MIKLTRIDDRLVHGQVAFTWVPSLGIDCLVVANDKVASDEFLKLTLGLAKPARTQLMIKSLKESITFLNSEKSKALKILLLVSSIKDAALLSAQVPEIRSVNFGGIRGKEGSKLISKAIAVNDDDITLIRQLADDGIELEIRQVPSDTKRFVQSLI